MKTKKIFLFFSCLALLAVNAALFASEKSLVDLETYRQEFVIKTEQIVIPAYPDAFNPSITRWEGQLLLSFRARDPLTLSTNQVYMTWLDSDFKPVGGPSRLEMPQVYPEGSCMQDPRLIEIDHKLYIVYSNVWKGFVTDVKRVFVAEVLYDGSSFYVENCVPLLKFDGDPKNIHEKNWVPFDYQGDLLLSYSIIPHKVFLPFLNSSQCATIALSHAMGDCSWDWGELRGGTPALEVDGEYLAFFHCSKFMRTVHSQGKLIQHYFMGAYTFESSPPFSVTKMSSEIIVGENFYHGKSYKTWKPLRVVFPAGFVFDEEYVWVVYGRQDYEMWVVKMDKIDLLKSLKKANK